MKCKKTLSRLINLLSLPKVFILSVLNDVGVKRYFDPFDTRLLRALALSQSSSYDKIIIGKFPLIVQFSFIKKTENPAKDSRFLILYD